MYTGMWFGVPPFWLDTTLRRATKGQSVLARTPPSTRSVAPVM
jgi:hypothetical protein